jgi:hypothetical protein
MLRVVAIVAVLTISFDHMILGGKYTNVVRQIASAILYKVH